MHETGCSGLVHWDDPEGWDGEGSGTEGQDGGHMCTHGWLMSMYGKNHYNIVNLKNKIKYKKKKEKHQNSALTHIYGI